MEDPKITTGAGDGAISSDTDGGSTTVVRSPARDAPAEQARNDPVPGRAPTDTAGLVSFETYRKAGEHRVQTEQTSDDQGRQAGAWRRHPLARFDLIAAAVLLAAALLVRWPFIARGETLLHSDEAVVGLMAQDIAAGQRFPIYFYGQRYMGALEAYGIAAVSPLFDNPIHALRFGPACFFALCVAVQYLMLTRWFGRRGGLIGAAALLAAAPMLTQWSISARGGYVEILLWGSALMWAYSEWFVPPVVCRRRPVHRFLLGGLIGSGLWINPSIVLFIVPILAHALLHRPLAAVFENPSVGPRLRRAAGLTGMTTLPVVVLLAILLLNAIWAVWVENGRVHNLLLLGVLPQPIAAGLLAVAGGGALLLAARKTNIVTDVRSLLRANGLVLLGILAGAAPAILYVLQTVVGSRPMDPSLPLGIRPIWLAGDTLNYLVQGLPLLFGADPRPFLHLVSVGRDTTVLPLDLMTAAVVMAENWIVLGALATSLVILLASHRRDLCRVMKLEPGNHPPVVLLMLGFVGMLGLFVMGGCALDFTTIRYLVPLWAFLPGLLAAVFVSRRFRPMARLAPVCLCAAWAVGQYAMYQQLGNPHPLRRLATVLTDRGIDPAIAEPLDAHLLSYLTDQRCRTAEFESFWPRLAHFRPAVEGEGPADYIVQTHEIDRTRDWIRGGWPGHPPPETTRFLWPRLRRAMIVEPAQLVGREPLVGGYEWVRLRRPLPERSGTASRPARGSAVLSWTGVTP